MKNANGQYAANGRPISNQSPRLLNLKSPTANSTSQQIARNRLTWIAGSIPVSKKEEPRKKDRKEQQERWPAKAQVVISSFTPRWLIVPVLLFALRLCLSWRLYLEHVSQHFLERWGRNGLSRESQANSSLTLSHYHCVVRSAFVRSSCCYFHTRSPYL